MKDSNRQLLNSLKGTLQKITTTVTGIESQVNTATVKATDAATKTLNERVNKAADNAVKKMDEQAIELCQDGGEAELSSIFLKSLNVSGLWLATLSITSSRRS